MSDEYRTPEEQEGLNRLVGTLDQGLTKSWATVTFQFEQTSSQSSIASHFQSGRLIYRSLLTVQLKIPAPPSPTLFI